MTDTTTSSGRLARVSWISLSATAWRSSAAILSRSTAGSHATSPAPTGAGSSSAVSGCIRSRAIVNALERMRSEGEACAEAEVEPILQLALEDGAIVGVRAHTRARFADLSSSSQRRDASCLMTRRFFKLQLLRELVAKVKVSPVRGDTHEPAHAALPR